MIRTAVRTAALTLATAALTFGAGTALGVHDPAPHNVAPNLASRIAVTPIDTGDRAEDSQPRYALRLARAGWDYNPGCAGRADWFPVGHPCHTGHVVYPTGATVG